MIKRVWFLQHLCPKLGFTKNRVASFDIGTLVMGHMGHCNESEAVRGNSIFICGLEIIFFPNFFVKNFFLKFFKFSRHADLRGFGVAAYENMPAWRRPAAACITDKFAPRELMFAGNHSSPRTFVHRKHYFAITEL